MIEKRQRRTSFFFSLVIGMLLVGVLPNVYSQETGSTDAWPPQELQNIEERFDELMAQAVTLEEYAPNKLFPDFQEMEKINQLVETLDFNDRKFKLLIEQYNLLEDELFPFVLKYYPEHPEVSRELYENLSQYTGKGDKSILTLQRNINTVALQMERLKKRIERLQIAAKEKEIAEEAQKKAEANSSSNDVSLQLLQLEDDLAVYNEKLAEEREKLERLKKEEKERIEKIEEKRKEIEEIRQKEANAKDRISRLIFSTFSDVREIRLNGLEIPKLNTIKTFEYLADTTIDTLKEKIANTKSEIQSLKIKRKDEFTSKLIKSFLVIAVALLMIFLLIGISRRVSKKILAKMEESEKIDAHRKQRYQTLSAVILSFVRVLVWIMAVLWVLGELNIDVAPFLVAAGGISLAIGFGAQSLVKDMVSGFFILMEEQFALGDVVEINGLSGVIEKISLRTIKFRGLNGTMHTVPNGSISQVSNMTYQWSRALVKVGVSYDDDTQKVLSVLQTVCQEFYADPDWKKLLIEEPIPQGIISFGDSSVNFRIMAKTPPGEQWGVERELHIRVKKAFDQNGIEIPYNFINLVDRTEHPENEK